MLPHGAGGRRRHGAAPDGGEVVGDPHDRIAVGQQGAAGPFAERVTGCPQSLPVAAPMNSASVPTRGTSECHSWRSEAGHGIGSTMWTGFPAMLASISVVL